MGRKVAEHRGALLLSQPMEHGRVRDWGEMELLWRHCCQEAGGGSARAAEARPLLLTVAPQTPRAEREAAAAVLFESLRAPAAHLAPTATLALYATGRTTGLVLECGEGVTAATPVYEGFALPPTRAARALRHRDGDAVRLILENALAEDAARQRGAGAAAGTLPCMRGGRHDDGVALRFHLVPG